MSDREKPARNSRHHKDHTGDYSFADHVRAAELAWDLWKSGDSRDWDRALALKDKIVKQSPKAWQYAMKEVQTQEEVERRLPAHLRTFQAGEKRGLRAYEREDGCLELREAPDPYATKNNLRFAAKRQENHFIEF